MLTPPTPPTPPATPGAPQPPTPPQPLNSAAIIARLVADGLMAPGTRQVDVFLSDHQLIVNGQPQPMALLASYRRYFGVREGVGTATFSLRVT